MAMRMIVALLAAATLATPALAAPGYEESRVRVQTADLDLSSAPGQRLLTQRLEVAMTRLCGTPVFFSREEIADLDACRADAMKAAAPQIDSARALQGVAVASSR
jgi:UrcA family protein